jgi:hypothetical protein
MCYLIGATWAGTQTDLSGWGVQSCCNLHSPFDSIVVRCPSRCVMDLADNVCASEAKCADAK